MAGGGGDRRPPKGVLGVLSWVSGEGVCSRLSAATTLHAQAPTETFCRLPQGRVRPPSPAPGPGPEAPPSSSQLWAPLCGPLSLCAGM